MAMRIRFGSGRSKALLPDVGSDIVEPTAAAATILLSELVIPLLPHLLGFAEGAMMHVAVEELVPQISEGERSNVGTVLFAAVFTPMMALDVASG